EKPSSRRPRASTPRSSSSSSTIRIAWPRLTQGLSFLAKDRAERKPADLQGGERRRREAAGDGRAAEADEEAPGNGQVVRRGIEHMLQHRDQHLGQQPAEQRRERERSGEDERRLAPEEGGGAPERGTERGHRRQLMAPLRQADGDEQR